jgi:ribosome-binding protein aMBF1 (putative translation factor)
MKRKLSPWCKAVKIALIQKDWSVGDLADAVKMSKEYTSSVINGRVISEQAAKVISDVLNIEQTALTSSE